MHAEAQTKRLCYKSNLGLNKGEDGQLNKNKLISLLRILVLILAAACYFAQGAAAQSHQQRLIPLFIEKDSTPTDDDKIPDQDDELYRAVTLKTGKSLGSRIDDRFVVYGRSPDRPHAGISPAVERYRYIPFSGVEENLLQPKSYRLPDLENFFDFGGTLELVTDKNSPLEKYDIVISEILWGLDTGLDDETTLIDANLSSDASKDDRLAALERAQKIELQSQRSQWIELYHTRNRGIDAIDKEITIAYDEATKGSEEILLYLLFTPFASYPDRNEAKFERTNTNYKVLDAVSTLFFGRWELPGKSGRRPTSAFISAYRDIDYDTVENVTLERSKQVAGIPFGSHPTSWKATPAVGRRNTLLRVVDADEAIALPYITTPGTRHTPGVYVDILDTTPVPSDSVVINEVRNDTSRNNVDWIELKNVGTQTIDLDKWELSLVSIGTTGEKKGKRLDEDLVDLPPYNLARDEILLILNKSPARTDLAQGIGIANSDRDQRRSGLTHKYFVDETLNMPADKKFVLLLRSENDKNGKDEMIEDYAGNGFFSDGHTTEFWPRLAQPPPTNVADFGKYTFASRNQAWARLRYEADDGHHKDAWAVVGPQGGLGYATAADLNYAPGTPGYENTAVKTQLQDRIAPVNDNEYDDGEISISEIMCDPGPNQNRAQWIELYNSSMTQAVNLGGWKLEIRNLLDNQGAYVRGSFQFEDVTLLPNQTLLIVSESAATNVSRNRTYDLSRNHRRELAQFRGPALLLNPAGFNLKLIDTLDPEVVSDDVVVDEAGNLTLPGASETAWELPPVNPDRRRSLVRLYGEVYTPEQSTGRPSPPEKGTSAEGWREFSPRGVSYSFYGIRNDLSSPGYRLGGPLPVALSSFRPLRMETGEVHIKWRTESELNNAGFNILRSENREGEFRVINVKGIIPGHGTSSETHIYSYTDTTAKPNVIYYYRIEDVAFDGGRRTLATVRLKGDISAADKLTTTWSRLKARE